MTGIVHRGDVEAARCFASVKMRMRESGIDFRFTDSQLFLSAQLFFLTQKTTPSPRFEYYHETDAWML